MDKMLKGLQGLGVAGDTKNRIALLRQALRFADDSDEEEFLDEDAQEALINLLVDQNQKHNQTYHLTLHLLPLLSLPPYYLDLTHPPSPHPLLTYLSLASLLTTLYLLLRLPPTATALPVLDTLHSSSSQPPLSPSEQDALLAMVLDSDSGSDAGQYDADGVHHRPSRHYPGPDGDGRPVMLRHGSTRARAAPRARRRKRERMRGRAYEVLEEALLDGRVPDGDGGGFVAAWVWTGKLAGPEVLLPKGNVALAAAAMACGFWALLAGTEWGWSGVSPFVMGIVPGGVYAMVLCVKVCMAGVKPGDELVKYMYNLKSV